MPYEKLFGALNNNRSVKKLALTEVGLDQDSIPLLETLALYNEAIQEIDFSKN